MLSPSDLPAVMKDQMSTELPEGKTIVDVFADLMRHLFDATKATFESWEKDGALRWKSTSESIELVLAHPFGWGGQQQAHLRDAAVKAGIVKDTDADSHIHFVTEGEANFCYYVAFTAVGKSLKVCHTVPTKCQILTHSKPGEQVLIIDAGGGTIGISTHRVLSNEPLRVEELHEPKCEPDPSRLQVFPFDNIHFRFDPRRRACNRKGNSDGTRCVLTPRPQTDYSTATREVETFQIRQ